MQRNNNNLANFLSRFEDSCKEMQQNLDQGKWGFEYDSDGDVLYLMAKGGSFSPNSMLVPAGSSGISVRIGEDGKIEGILIDSFSGYFLPDNVEFSRLYENLTRQRSHQPEPIAIQNAFAMVLNKMRIGTQDLAGVAAIA